MKLTFKAGELEAPAANSAVFLYDAGDLKKRPELKNFAPLLAPLLKNGEFKGSYLSELPLKTEGGWLFLVGLGSPEKISPAKIIEAAAAAAKMALTRKAKTFDFILPPLPDAAEGAVLELCAQGALLSLYRQTEFKSEAPPEQSLAGVRFRAASAVKNARARLQEAQITAEATLLARRLGDAPPNAMYPESFAREALALAKGLNIKASVLDEKALAGEKMGLILAVGQGSTKKPRLVVLEYKGGPARQKPVVLAGKGITFDSGGLSLKPANGMETMKTDMAGAAAVLAVVRAAAQMKLPINLAAIMPLAENLPGGGAARVGDVVTSKSGLTVEITNTDAEGRLVLADALTFALEKMKPRLIIDVATLTGAAKAALGELHAAVFANDGALEGRLLSAARSAGEGLWPLPMIDEYDEQLESRSADLVNCPSGLWGRAIVAALFLRRFVPVGAPWAHLDIAGPARADKARPSTPAGASGFAVRTLLVFLRDESGGK